MEVIVNAGKVVEFGAMRESGTVGNAGTGEAHAAAQRVARWRERPRRAAPVEGSVDLPLELAGDASGDGDVQGNVPGQAGDGMLGAARVGAPAEAPEATAPQRALHDDDLSGLARRAQGATLRLDFELRTGVARQVFRRDFVHVSRQLHALEASRRVQGLDRALLNDALAAIQRRADDLQALFARIASELEATLVAHGHAGATIEFARPARFQATVVSPCARRFVDLIRHADDALCQVEKAWLLGLLAPPAKTGLVGDCRRALLGFKDHVRERRQAIGAHVREVNAQRGEPGHPAEPQD